MGTRILVAVLDQNDPSAGSQCAAEALHHFEGMGNFMEGTDEQDASRLSDGSLASSSAPRTGVTLVIARRSMRLCRTWSISGLHVDRVDATRRDGLGDAGCEIAGACADVGDLGIGGKPDAINHPIGLLLDDTGPTLQPGGALVTHDFGDLAAEIGSTDPVAAWGWKV
jgi:hypothetical protein